MYTCKVILLGKSYVGKSSIINRYIYNEYKTNLTTTIGASYYTKTIDTQTGKIKFNLWDCSGMEVYNSLLPMYYRSTNIAVVVYDVTSLASYNQCQKSIDDLKKNTENVSIILVANKIDLEREVVYQDGLLLANFNKISYHECSAKTGQGVLELFDLIASKLDIKLLDGQTMRDKPIRLEEKEEKSCCY